MSLPELGRDLGGMYIFPDFGGDFKLPILVRHMKSSRFRWDVNLPDLERDVNLLRVGREMYLDLDVM